MRCLNYYDLREFLQVSKRIHRKHSLVECLIYDQRLKNIGKFETLLTETKVQIGFR